MAQAKARPSTKRSQGRKRSPAPKKNQAQHSRSAPNRGSNGKARVGAARQTVESSTKEAGHAVSKAASNAKTPLLASGAALAGVAGGLAIGTMRSRRSHFHKALGLKMPQGKRVKIRSRDVAKAAREVGALSQHVAELATELRRARENTNGGKRRSPVEVVLNGLTARH
jgi:HAMP domain-containing protein